MDESPNPPAGTMSAPHHGGGGIRRGSGLYLIASLVSQASALVRYVILARLLGPEQLGIAATLVVTASFFDLISDTGSDRFLIQDRHGDTPEVQRLVHLVYAGRGIVIALSLAVFAIPIAHFYKTPALAGGLAILALSPLILGFQHLDYRRAQRDHDFRAEAACMIAAEFTGLVATAAAAWLTHSFHAVLYGLITRAVVLVVVSHLQADRPYRMRWEIAHARRLSRFAFPLMLNGLMLFVVSQGDRVIVGRELGLKALGYYSATMLLIYYPSVLLARYIHAIYIPLIAAERDNSEARNGVTDALGGATIVLTIGMMIGFALVAPIMIPVLFGHRFAQDAMLVALIGILQTARFLLNWPSTASLAMGRSATVLTSNLTHFFAFGCAILGLKLLGGLQGIVAGFIVGELACAVAAIVLLNRDTGRSRAHGLIRLLEFTLAAGVVLLWHAAGGISGWLGYLGAAIASVVLATWLWRREAAAVKAIVGIAVRTAAPVLGALGRRAA